MNRRFLGRQMALLLLPLTMTPVLGLGAELDTGRGFRPSHPVSAVHADEGLRQRPSDVNRRVSDSPSLQEFTSTESEDGAYEGSPVTTYAGYSSNRASVPRSGRYPRGVPAPVPCEEAGPFLTDCPCPAGSHLDAIQYPPGMWVSMDFMMAWRKGRTFPALVTTTANPVDVDTDGQLGQPGTQILFGGNRVGGILQPAGRFDIGSWFDQYPGFGIGARFTALGHDTVRFSANSTQNSVLAIPFFNRGLNPASEDTLLIADPLDGTTGSINAVSRSELYIGNVYGRFAHTRAAEYEIDLIAGYLTSRINEDLLLTSRSTGNTTFVFRDSFDTTNEFHGGDFGFWGRFRRGAWDINILSKLAIGSTRERAIISGTTTTNGTVTSTTTGLFAQPSNGGDRFRDIFTVVPELNLNWAYHLSPRCDVTMGYTFVYWSRAAQPGMILDRTVDASQTVRSPSFQFRDSSYALHGLTFGIQYNR